MDNRITILDELKEISPLLATIGHEGPYTVPAGYFDGLAKDILLKITMDEQESPAVPGLGKTPVYQVPAGYFDDLAARVLNRIKASSAATPKEELSFLSPLLHKLENKSPFTTPAGYFTDLPDNVVSGVQAIGFVNEELENLSLLMAGLREKQVYTTPARYFDQLPHEILKRVKQPAKLVSVSFSRRIVRYAAAAVVAGAIAVGGYLYFAPKTAGSGTFEIPGMAKVSDQELENFLTDTTNTIALADAGTIVTNDTIGEGDSKDLFANVSDEELQKYLEEHGGNPNAVTN